MTSLPGNPGKIAMLLTSVLSRGCRWVYTDNCGRLWGNEGRGGRGGGAVSQLPGKVGAREREGEQLRCLSLWMGDGEQFCRGLSGSRWNVGRGQSEQWWWGRGRDRGCASVFLFFLPVGWAHREAPGVAACLFPALRWRMQNLKIPFPTLMVSRAGKHAKKANHNVPSAGVPSLWSKPNTFVPFLV